MDKLPELTPEGAVKVDVLFDLFFMQLMTFSDFMNEAKDKIPTWKYADVVLYCMQKRLDEFKVSFPEIVNKTETNI